VSGGSTAQIGSSGAARTVSGGGRRCGGISLSAKHWQKVLAARLTSAKGN
jgi:hypothetical protein